MIVEYQCTLLSLPQVAVSNTLIVVYLCTIVSPLDPLTNSCTVPVLFLSSGYLTIILVKRTTCGVFVGVWWRL